MRKIVRKQGNSLCMIINKEDRTVYDLKEGDFIEVTIKKIRKKK